MSSRQDQNGGDQSANLQAGRDIIIGPTVRDVMDIANMAIDANMEKFRGVAGIVAEKLVREMLRDVGFRLEKESTEVIAYAATPGFQIALLDAEKSYVKTGDVDLKERLTDLLIEQARRPNRSLIQIVLGEALAIAPSVPSRSFNTLSMLFVLRGVTITGITSLDHLATALRTICLPFLQDWPPTNFEMRHLAYLGCVQIEYVTSFNLLENGLRVTYKDLLSHLSAQELNSWFIGLDSRMSNFISDWERLFVKSAMITPVGIVLGHHNCKRKIDAFPDVEIFLEEPK